MRTRILAALVALLAGSAQAQVNMGSIQYSQTPIVEQASDPRYSMVWTDFVPSTASSNGFGSLLLTSSNSLPSELNRPGIIQVVPSGANQISMIYSQSGSTTNRLSTIDRVRLDARFYTAANVPKNRIGIINGLGDPPTHGIYFERLSADTNWFAVSRTSTGETRADTGVAWANEFRSFEVVYKVTSVDYYIDGVLKATNTANIPAPTTQTLNSVTVVTTGTAANVDVDWYSMKFRTTRNGPLRMILAYGDSKTTAAGYPYILTGLLNKYGTRDNEILVSQVGGSTLETRQPTIAADIAGLVTALGSKSFDTILFNMGVNDAGTAVTEAAWKADLADIIDAMHAQWPAARIYFSYVWGRAPLASKSATINGWIADFIALRPMYCFTGPNEYVFLENGDDGATYTTDGVHPTPTTSSNSGYSLTAQKWIEVIGY